MKKPKWRLVPNSRGTYNLEEYINDLDIYLIKEIMVTEEQAKEHIKNLERPIKYLEDR